MTKPRDPGVRLAWAEVPHGASRRDTAWALLRGLLPDGAALSNPCPRCGGPHGPVRVAGADARAGVAYAGSLAVVAVADAARFERLGIDAEREHDPTRDAAGLAGILGTGPATLRDWTRVEAALKADGRGLRVDPSSVSVRQLSGTGPGGFTWEAAIPDGDVFSGWDAEGPAGVIVSVAVRLRRAAEAERDQATP